MIFFDLLSRLMKIKTKTNKWDLIKLKRFCTAKKMINKMPFYFFGAVLQWFTIVLDVFSEITFEVPTGKKFTFCFTESGATAQAFCFSYLR